jgi:hypothetical protein
MPSNLITAGFVNISSSQTTHRPVPQHGGRHCGTVELSKLTNASCATPAPPAAGRHRLRRPITNAGPCSIDTITLNIRHDLGQVVRGRAGPLHAVSSANLRLVLVAIHSELLQALRATRQRFTRQGARAWVAWPSAVGEGEHGHATRPISTLLN